MRPDDQNLLNLVKQASHTHKSSDAFPTFKVYLGMPKTCTITVEKEGLLVMKLVKIDESDECSGFFMCGKIGL